MQAAPVPGAGAPSRASNPAETLVCFSHLRWSFVYQRPQHLISRAARHYRVLFVEEAWFEDTDTPRLDLTHITDALTVAVPVLPHGCRGADAEAAQKRLVDKLLADEADGRLVFWYYTPMALAFSAHHRPELCVYDCMDELSAFRFAPPELVEREGELLNRADLVFTGGRSLYEAKRGKHGSVHAFPSSVDAAHFAQARRRDRPEPPDQSGIPQPRLGYFGVIDERADLALIAELAELRPSWQIVMIGPVVKIEEASLPRRDNIHWLGGKSYDELPAYLAGWDIGLMPFAINEHTRYISPTKTPEYLAAGLPVVSTPVVDVVRDYGDSGLVEIAVNAAEVAAKTERLLASPDPSWLARVDRHLATMSWDKTWSAMHALMREEVARCQKTDRRLAAETVHV